MGKGTAVAVGGIVVVGGGVGLAYKGFKKLKNALSDSGAKISYPALKERPTLLASGTSAMSQQPSVRRDILEQPAWSSTYQTQPPSYRDRQATATYDALGAGDFHTANKHFEYLVRADGNDF